MHLWHEMQLTWASCSKYLLRSVFINFVVSISLTVSIDPFLTPI